LEHYSLILNIWYNKRMKESSEVKNGKSTFPKYIFLILLFLILISSLPLVLIFTVQHEQVKIQENKPDQFPVTVDPRRKIITEKTEVNAYLEGNGTTSPLSASVSGAFSSIWSAFKSALVAIAETPWYHSMASVAGLDGHLVTITPGMRKEQVANAFAKRLDWDKAEKKDFLTQDLNSNTSPSEGSFFPDTYFVSEGMTPDDVQKLINKNFKDNVVIRYGTSTEQVVPIKQALNIASIIQRETIGNKDMRLISGIIWNRLFEDMKLQVDATLQYAKASKTMNGDWWPRVVPADKYIKSPYNTYLHAGLPPTPIASPTVGAILAALNPIETPCLYYFNDKKGEFHCNKTYKEHVNQLRKYY